MGTCTHLLLTLQTFFVKPPGRRAQTDTTAESEVDIKRSGDGRVEPDCADESFRHKQHDLATGGR